MRQHQNRESFMIATDNPWLIAAAVLSGIAALLHVAIVIGGAQWYRFFGAGEKMALAAQTGRVYPAIVTMGIAAVLSVWAAYALSAAGLLMTLPFLKWGLMAITAIYLLRGLAIIPLSLFALDQVTPFLFWSSVICTGYGVVHLIGVMQVWAKL
jgi:hypothetical protein